MKSTAEVTVGERGRIEGELAGERVVISGRFDGSIQAKRLEIVAGGQVDGDVTVGELVIEPGARFNGNSRIQSQDSRSAAHARADHPAGSAKPGQDQGIRASTTKASEAG